MNTQILFWFSALVMISHPLWAGSDKRERVDGIVAIVGSEIILQSDVKQLKRQLATPGIAEAMYGKTLAQLPTDEDVLQMVIEEKLVEEAVRGIGIQISEDEVESTITQIAAKNNASKEQLIEMLKQEGMKYDEYKDNIRLRLKKDRFRAQFITPYVSVSDEQVKRALEKEHPALALYDATLVILTPEELEAWKTLSTSAARKQKLEAGGFKNTPTTYAGYFHDMAPEVAKALRGKKAGFVTPVIALGDQHVVVRVDRIRQGHVEDTPQYQEQFQQAKTRLLQQAYQKYMERWVRQQKYNIDIQIIDSKKS